MQSEAQINEPNGFDELFTVLGCATMVFCGVWLLSRLMDPPRHVVQEKPREKVDDGEPYIDVEVVEVTNAAPVEPATGPGASTALAIMEVMPPPAVAIPVFEYSGDFRNIKYRGVPQNLTLYQSLAMKELWEAHQSGFPEINQDVLLKEVGNANQRRVRDTFKSNKHLLGTLIIKGKRKGSFLLNLV